MEYRLTNEILETLRNSPVDFVITYHNSKEEIKKRIRDLLEKVCSEKMPVDRIIKETKNLFFLHSSDLLDDNDIAPQRNTAIKTLEELERLLDL